LTLTLLHCDDLLVVVDKPAGMLSVPGRGADKSDCVSARVQAMFADALIVHRLDMATSGVLVLARGAAVQRQLSMAFAGREVQKRYIAVVHGRVELESGAIDLPLITDWPNRPKQKVDHARGKPSLTHYRLLAYDPLTDHSRVELEPVTGRSHQLRVHLLAAGHPIVGDALYGTGEAAARLLLHACELQLPHPADGRWLTLRSEPPF
jgi:tRNA pseudouridine32 synthase/23S rRNA pseudouridine746 synthase